MSGPRPPRLAEHLLWLLLVPRDRDHALGDLHEEFVELHRARGSRAAGRFYWSQTLRAIVPSLRQRWKHRSSSMRDVRQEVALAVRTLLRRKSTTSVALVTLGLGIGAATAIYSVADAVLLRPLPYQDGERLIQVWNTYDSWRGHEVLDALWDRVALSYPEYTDWRRAQTSFDEVAVYGSFYFALTGDGDPDRIPVGIASTSLFPMLGVSPVLGRLFTPDEEGPAAPDVVVLSHETWRDRYGGAPEIVGETVILEDTPFAIVGVLPAGFALQPIASRETQAMWIPIAESLGRDIDRGNHHYEALGRLTESATLESAHGETAAILSAGSRPGSRGARLATRKTEEIGDAANPLLLLLASVGLLLLIACGNVATLLIAEVHRRRRDIATRTAIGAETSRIIRQLLVESTVLGLGGSLLGLGVAWLGVRAILRLAPASLTFPTAIGLDARIFTFAVAIGIASGIFSGLTPGWLVTRRVVHGVLRGVDGHESLGGRRSQRFVLGAQLALSLLLLVVGGLLARSAMVLSAVEPGFDPAGVVAASVSVPASRYSREEAALFHHQVVDRLAATPGITAVGAVSAMPFSGLGGSSSFQLVGREVPDDVKQPEALRRTVLPGYHQAMGIPLLVGRHLDRRDGVFERPAIVISRAMADRFWPDGSAIGARISRDRREWEVVGIVEDVLHADLAQEAQPTFYVPLDAAENTHTMTVFVRTTDAFEDAAASLRQAVWALDAAPVENVTTAASLVARSTQTERFRTVLVVAFALAATLLSAVGLFGVTARVVSGRARELGVRVALGAHRALLFRRVVREESRALLLGSAAGLAGATWASSMLSGFLFGVEAGDLPTYCGALAVLLLTGLLSVGAAARRALDIDPVEAFRSD